MGQAPTSRRAQLLRALADVDGLAVGDQLRLIQVASFECPARGWWVERPSSRLFLGDHVVIASAMIARGSGWRLEAVDL
jgi:hypothetical protein